MSVLHHLLKTEHKAPPAVMNWPIIIETAHKVFVLTVAVARQSRDEWRVVALHEAAMK